MNLGESSNGSTSVESWGILEEAQEKTTWEARCCLLPPRHQIYETLVPVEMAHVPIIRRRRQSH